MAFNNAVEQSKLVLGHENEHEAEKEKLFKFQNKNAFQVTLIWETPSQEILKYHP